MLDAQTHTTLQSFGRLDVVQRKIEIFLHTRLYGDAEENAREKKECFLRHDEGLVANRYFS